MIYNKKFVKQLKLVSGEEVLCEIMEEDENDLVVRNIYRMVSIESDDGNFYWVFKPFMFFQEDPNKMLLLKSDKIVAVASPIDKLIGQYEVAIKQFEKDLEEEALLDGDDDGGDDDRPSNVIKLH
jgi:hypothetical protein